LYGKNFLQLSIKFLLTFYLQALNFSSYQHIRQVFTRGRLETGQLIGFRGDAAEINLGSARIFVSFHNLAVVDEIMQSHRRVQPAVVPLDEFEREQQEFRRDALRLDQVFDHAVELRDHDCRTYLIYVKIPNFRLDILIAQTFGVITPLSVSDGIGRYKLSAAAAFV
jgi:hypothetical protein